MSFGGLFKTGNQLFKAFNADIGTRFQATIPEDSESDDEVDPNFLAHGKRGISVYNDVATRKVVHLDHEARAIRFYRDGVNQRKSYRLSGIISIFRTSATVVMFETKRTKALNAKVITLQNEDITTEFLASVMYLLDHGDVVLSSFYCMVESKRGVLNISGLHSALQLYDMNAGLSNRDLQQVLDLADVPDQFDFLDYFKILLGTPVNDHRDCLNTLLKKSLLKANNLSHGDAESMRCLDENLPFTLDTRLILGESVLDTAFFTRWLVSNTHDRDIFTSGCTDMLDSSSNFTHCGSISRCVHASSKPGFIGHVLLTDYRIIFQNIHKANLHQNANYMRYSAPSFFDTMSVPLASIASVVLKPEPTSLLQKIYIKIRTKDNRKLRLIFLKNGTTFDMAKLFYQKIVSLCFASRNIEKAMFAFKYKEQFCEEQTWSWSDILRDYTRLGLIKNPEWKILENTGIVNPQVCSSYPSYLVIPIGLSDEDLVSCTAFRSRQRLPTVTYVHKATHACLTRSAQNLSSAGSRLLQADVRLLNMYRTSGLFNEQRELERPSTFYIFDARSMMAAMANMAAGRGTEEVDNYNHTEIIFCGIDNIHVMRNSFEAVCKAVLVDAKCALSEMDTIHLSTLQKSTSTISHREEHFDFLKKVDASNWISHCSKVLMASVLLAEKLHLEGCSCLVHCSDGWDRTAQMTAIAQILLDPYYRTLEGFAVLVEKEFCAFGHKFDDRCGHLRYSSAKDAEERSPIFVQFLDIVHNIVHQFPFSFEFSQELLVFLADHVNSCLFGNFLGNTEAQRVQQLHVRQKTQSVWSYVLRQRKFFLNDRYVAAVEEAPSVIWPAFNPRSLRLWDRFFLRWTVNAHLPATPWHDDWGNSRETYRDAACDTSASNCAPESGPPLQQQHRSPLTRVHSEPAMAISIAPQRAASMHAQTLCPVVESSLAPPAAGAAVLTVSSLLARVVGGEGEGDGEGPDVEDINISLADVSSDSDSNNEEYDTDNDSGNGMKPRLASVSAVHDDDDTCSV